MKMVLDNSFFQTNMGVSHFFSRTLLLMQRCGTKKHGNNTERKKKPEGILLK